MMVSSICKSVPVKIRSLILVAALAAVQGLPLRGQDTRLDPANFIKFDLGNDAPVSVQAVDSSESRATSRGGALMIDLHVALKLRNNSGDTIRGVTLLLLAHESTSGGKTSVAKPSINVAPGETFPIQIDGRLMRPMQAGNGPLVHVSIDGILFKNYEFYGPDRLNSRRQMVAWEMQAERDRKYFKQILQTRGVAGLQHEMLQSLDRQANRPHLDVQLARGRSTPSAISPDHMAQFAFLQIPESPIKPIDGSAEIAGNEARTPRIEVKNTSGKNIRYLEIAWLVKDYQGREYLAGSIPAAEGELYLPPGRSAKLLQDTSLRFSQNGGKPVEIQNMTGFVSQVEFSDHKVWIPTRESLNDPRLAKVVPPSPEEQRLCYVYRTEGPDGLLRELNKF